VVLVPMMEGPLWIQGSSQAVPMEVASEGQVVLLGRLSVVLVPVLEEPLRMQASSQAVPMEVASAGQVVLLGQVSVVPVPMLEEPLRMQASSQAVPMESEASRWVRKSQVSWAPLEKEQSVPGMVSLVMKSQVSLESFQERRNVGMGSSPSLKFL
jgi:hypothetical protein